MTQNDQLTIISEKLWSLFKKADNQRTFYSSQQSFILFLKIGKNQTNKKKSEKKKKKSRTKYFFFIFRNCPKRRCQGVRRLHCQEDEVEEAAGKKIKNLKNHKKFKKLTTVHILSPLKVFLKRIKQKRPLQVHK